MEDRADVGLVSSAGIKPAVSTRKNHELIVADRWFPSSKLCRKCGQVKDEFPLSQRTFICSCGHIEDRDENAANNLLTLGYRGINACGHGSSGSDLSGLSETAVDEAGILMCSEMNT